jgi:hypothetical protein
LPTSQALFWLLTKPSANEMARNVPIGTRLSTPLFRSFRTTNPSEQSIWTNPSLLRVIVRRCSPLCVDGTLSRSCRAGSSATTVPLPVAHVPAQVARKYPKALVPSIYGVQHLRLLCCSPFDVVTLQLFTQPYCVDVWFDGSMLMNGALEKVFRCFGFSSILKVCQRWQCGRSETRVRGAN